MAPILRSVLFLTALSIGASRADRTQRLRNLNSINSETDSQDIEESPIVVTDTTWDSQEHAFDKTLALNLAKLSQKTYDAANGPIDLGDIGISSWKGYPIGDDYAILGRSTGNCFVSFRGSSNDGSWIGENGNLDAVWKDFKKNKNNGEVMVYAHAGFVDTYNDFRFTGSATTPFLNDVRQCLGAMNSLVLTGHSRGGALAALMAIHFTLDETLDLDDSGQKAYELSRFRNASSQSLYIYTFGEPRGLSGGLAKKPWSNVHNIQNKFRFVNGKDIVPSIPFSPYKHWGATFAISSSTSSAAFNDNDYPSFSLSRTATDHSLAAYIQILASLK